jgi:hypothetical protein
MLKVLSNMSSTKSEENVLVCPRATVRRCPAQKSEVLKYFCISGTLTAVILRIEEYSSNLTIKWCMVDTTKMI